MSDLQASRTGDTITLSFTPPARNTDGSRIDGPVAYEIHRAYLGMGFDPEQEFPEKAELLRVLPAEAAAGFTAAGRVRVPVPLGGFVTSPAIIEAYFSVRAVNARGEHAGFSNFATVRRHPPPPVPRDLTATVTETGVALRWTPIVKENVAAGYVGDVLIGYRIFRRKDGEGDFALLATLPGTTSMVGEYVDMSVEWGSLYAYRLRTMTTFADESAEGFDTEPVEVLAEDTFPPAPPQRLVAVGGPGRVDLSWDASPSPDVAGYRISRMREGNEDPILAPLDPIPGLSFADTTALPGVEYTYFVAAIDVSGNQSEFSNPATATTVIFEDE